LEESNQQILVIIHVSVQLKKMFTDFSVLALEAPIAIVANKIILNKFDNRPSKNATDK
jgi:hypothetical protein